MGFRFYFFLYYLEVGGEGNGRYSGEKGEEGRLTPRMMIDDD